MNAELKEMAEEALESKGFKMSRAKIEYMHFNFSGDVQRAETNMRTESLGILRRDSFRYLGLIISKNGEIEEDVENWIRAGWLKWRFASGVLCDLSHTNEI